MNRRDSTPLGCRPPAGRRSASLLAKRARAERGGLRLGTLAVLLAGMLGCSAKPQVRSQSAEESDRDRYPVKTVGDVTTFSNADPIPVSGVGLVEGLEGTGGPAPAGGYRQMLEHDLQKQRVPRVKEVLNSPNTSMVLVSGLMPAGARRGDPFDVEITLPGGSRTSSLRGGILRRCLLYNYAFVRDLSSAPVYANSDATLKGQPVGVAEGALLVGFGGDEETRARQARIWGGGRSAVDRPLHLLLNSNEQFARVAKIVADRVNAAFQGTLPAGPTTEVAHARDKILVLLGIPPQYKHHPAHFMRVVRMVPLEDAPTPTPRDGRPRLPYREQLQEDLLDPARTVVAALRLEALGGESKRRLRRGLDSDSPLVRFCAAEATAYLGSTAGVDELGRIVQQQPYLRAYALTALASLDESACRDKLADLLNADLDDETRYGAFRALRSLDEHDEAVHGELLAETFWLHRVASQTPAMVHVSMSRRPEIVLFGKSQTLEPKFSLLAGEFAVTAAAGDERCTISHFPANGDGGGRVRCSLDLADILKTMAEQGATYPEVVELIRQAEGCRVLSCRVRQDALPQAVPVEELARAGRESVRPAKDKLAKDKLARDGAEAVQIIKPDSDLGTTPALFQTDGRRTPARDKDAQALQQERRQGKPEPKTAERE